MALQPPRPGSLQASLLRKLVQASVCCQSLLFNSQISMTDLCALRCLPDYLGSQFGHTEDWEVVAPSIAYAAWDCVGLGSAPRFYTLGMAPGA